MDKVREREANFEGDPSRSISRCRRRLPRRSFRKSTIHFSLFASLSFLLFLSFLFSYSSCPPRGKVPRFIRSQWLDRYLAREFECSQLEILFRVGRWTDERNKLFFLLGYIFCNEFEARKRKEKRASSSP